ncbi:MAG: hypothetical protein KDD48_05805 [Bdellovibrionales bacterium]|nr:hypothetical protein [Bdellovibrionales bacterium]
MLFTSCQERLSFSSFASRTGKNPPASNDCSEGGVCTDIFSQDGQFVTDKAALIFPIDTSGSMQTEGPTFAKAAAKVAEALVAEGFDKMCFGVLPGYITGNSGKLVSNSNGEYCICANQYALGDIEQKVLSIFDNINWSGGALNEAPEMATYNALTDQSVIDYNIQVSGGSCIGGADTAVFFFASGDENSIGEAVSDGSHTFEREGTAIDHASDETRARADYMSTFDSGTGKYVDTFTPQTVVDALYSYCGTLPCGYSFSGHTTDRSGVEEPNVANQQIASLTNGIFLDIQQARDDQAAFVQSFVDQVAPNLLNSLSYVNVIDAQYDICDAKPWTVSVNGIDVTASSVKIASNRIRINNLASLGLSGTISIELNYTRAGSFACDN